MDLERYSTIVPHNKMVRWPFVFLFLIFCGLAECSFGAVTTGNSPLLPHKDVGNEREFQNVYQKLTALTATISTGTFIPSGMISMFDAACPTGWTRFSALDNAFPQGAATYGGTGGASSASHTHTVTTSDHKHLLPIWSNAGETLSFVQQSGSNIDGFQGGQSVSVSNSMSLGTNLGTITGVNQSFSKAAGGETITTSNTSIPTVPPFVNVIWCKKN